MLRVQIVLLTLACTLGASAFASGPGPGAGGHPYVAPAPASHGGRSTSGGNPSVAQPAGQRPPYYPSTVGGGVNIHIGK